MASPTQIANILRATVPKPAGDDPVVTMFDISRNSFGFRLAPHVPRLARARALSKLKLPDKVYTQFRAVPPKASH
eukprot:3711600-Alexandrium_andersonii.AAC.1